MTSITTNDLFTQFNIYQIKNTIRLKHFKHILENLKIPYSYSDIQAIENICQDKIQFFEMIAYVTDIIMSSSQEQEEGNTEPNDNNDEKLHIYLNFLADYIQICEQLGDYRNLHRASKKIEEIQDSRQDKFVKLLSKFKQKEIKQLQQEKNQGLIEFENQWQAYFDQFDRQAQDKIKTFKKNQQNYKEQYEQNLRKDLSKSFRQSKILGELKVKEAQLLKLEQYEQAHRIKCKIEQLSQKEFDDYCKQSEEIILTKLMSLKKLQKSQLNSLVSQLEEYRKVYLRQKEQDEKVIVQNGGVSQNKQMKQARRRIISEKKLEPIKHASAPVSP